MPPSGGLALLEGPETQTAEVALARPGGHEQLLAKARESLDQLARLGTPKDFARLIDEAEVIRHAAKVGRLSVEGINAWFRYKVDVQREAARCIERLREKGELAGKGRPGEMSEARTFKELGVDRRRVPEWALLLSISEQDLDAAFASANSRGEVVSMRDLLRRPWAEERRAEVEREWVRMPSFDNRDLRPLQSVTIHFATAEAVEDFNKRTGMKLAPRTTQRLPPVWFGEPPTEAPPPVAEMPCEFTSDAARDQFVSRLIQEWCLAKRVLEKIAEAPSGGLPAAEQLRQIKALARTALDRLRPPKSAGTPDDVQTAPAEEAAP